MTDKPDEPNMVAVARGILDAMQVQIDGQKVVWDAVVAALATLENRMTHIERDHAGINAKLEQLEQRLIRHASASCRLSHERGEIE
jgi:hypothetical protein